MYPLCVYLLLVTFLTCYLFLCILFNLLKTLAGKDCYRDTKERLNWYEGWLLYWLLGQNVYYHLVDDICCCRGLVIPMKMTTKTVKVSLVLFFLVNFVLNFACVLTVAVFPTLQNSFFEAVNFNETWHFRKLLNDHWVILWVFFCQMICK